MNKDELAKAVRELLPVKNLKDFDIYINAGEEVVALELALDVWSEEEKDIPKQLLDEISKYSSRGIDYLKSIATH